MIAVETRNAMEGQVASYKDSLAQAEQRLAHVQRHLKSFTAAAESTGVDTTPYIQRTKMQYLPRLASCRHAPGTPLSQKSKAVQKLCKLAERCLTSITHITSSIPLAKYQAGLLYILFFTSCTFFCVTVTAVLLVCPS